MELTYGRINVKDLSLDVYGSSNSVKFKGKIYFDNELFGSVVNDGIGQKNAYLSNVGGFFKNGDEMINNVTKQNNSSLKEFESFLNPDVFDCFIKKWAIQYLENHIVFFDSKDRLSYVEYKMHNKPYEDIPYDGLKSDSECYIALNKDKVLNLKTLEECLNIFNEKLFIQRKFIDWRNKMEGFYSDLKTMHECIFRKKTLLVVDEAYYKNQWSSKQ